MSVPFVSDAKREENGLTELFTCELAHDKHTPYDEHTSACHHRAAGCPSVTVWAQGHRHFM